MKSSRSEVRQNRPSRLIGFFYKKIAKIGCFTNIFCKFAFSKSVITIGSSDKVRGIPTQIYQRYMIDFP